MPQPPDGLVDHIDTDMLRLMNLARAERDDQRERRPRRQGRGTDDPQLQSVVRTLAPDHGPDERARRFSDGEWH